MLPPTDTASNDPVVVVVEEFILCRPCCVSGLAARGREEFEQLSFTSDPHTVAQQRPPCSGMHVVCHMRSELSLAFRGALTKREGALESRYYKRLRAGWNPTWGGERAGAGGLRIARWEPAKTLPLSLQCINARAATWGAACSQPAAG